MSATSSDVGDDSFLRSFSKQPLASDLTPTLSFGPNNDLPVALLGRENSLPPIVQGV